MKLIDKSALVSELERLREKLQDKIETSDFIAGEVFIMNYFLSFLDTLEVKEVDLEKEISQQIEKYYDECENKLTSMSDDDTDISFLTLDKLCRYFFELGLKAQKGENNYYG